MENPFSSVPDRISSSLTFDRLVAVTELATSSVHDINNLHVLRQAAHIEGISQSCRDFSIVVRSSDISGDSVTGPRLLPLPPEPVQIDMMQEEHRICSTRQLSYEKSSQERKNELPFGPVKRLRSPRTLWLRNLCARFSSSPAKFSYLVSSRRLSMASGRIKCPSS